jgi:hypothetical protein
MRADQVFEEQDVHVTTLEVTLYFCFYVALTHNIKFAVHQDL